MSAQAQSGYGSFPAQMNGWGNSDMCGPQDWAMELTQLNQPLLTPMLASAFSIPLEYGHQEQMGGGGATVLAAGNNNMWGPQNSGGSEGNCFLPGGRSSAQLGLGGGGYPQREGATMGGYGRYARGMEEGSSRPDGGPGPIGYQQQPPPGIRSMASYGGHPGHPGMPGMPPPAHPGMEGAGPPGMGPPPPGMPHSPYTNQQMMGYSPWDNPGPGMPSMSAQYSGEDPPPPAHFHPLPGHLTPHMFPWH